MNNRKIAIDIFLRGVESVKPDNLIKNFVSIRGSTFKCRDIEYDLSKIKNIYVVGAGKASAIMAYEIESILKSLITRGHIVTKYNHKIPLKSIDITEAGHPIPDDNGIKGTKQIMSIVQNAKEGDLVICLISGGGSALLTDVPEGCSLEDIKELNNILLKSGATINQMNCIRKHLSNVKGGLLSKAAYPAKVVSLILSDVIGDPLDVIASGPTAPDHTTFADAISIIEYLKIKNIIPEGILRVLNEGLENKRQETLKEDDKVFNNTINLLIGTNTLALSSAKEMAESIGYNTSIMTNTLEGDVADIADYIINIALKTLWEDPEKKVCLLFGGEPTVKVAGTGLGGRNQHLALLVAKGLKNLSRVTFLSGGTDGTDGPTDAAGAVVDSYTYWKGSYLHLDIEKYIINYDSYNFFKQEGGLIFTGPTQTNVMDLMIILIN